MSEQLRRGCNDLSLDISDEKCINLIKYVALLNKWNQFFNLTSIKDQNEMISLHILDSLAILPYLKGYSLLDVGTGAGLPGIPIGIVRPYMSVSLIDSNLKKNIFLQQVKAELVLDNVTVINSRVEEAILPKFDLITARAFSTINNFIKLAGRHCDITGCMMLMKGMYPKEELQLVTDIFNVKDVILLDIPGCDIQRHLVRLIKN